MEYTFDYVLVPTWSFTVASTAMRTLYLLPSVSQGVCKVAVGDLGGVLTVKSVKKSVVSTAFSVTAGKRVSRVYGVKDKIFVSCGNEVKGFSKKGKNFYTIQTFLSEDILSLVIFGKTETMHVAGQHLYCSYVKNNELPYYNSKERMTDLVVMPVPLTLGQQATEENSTTVVACSDGTLRFIEGQTVSHTITLEHSPNVICEYRSHERVGYLVYGSNCGSIVLLQISKHDHEVIWIIDNPEGLACINCMQICDLTGNFSGLSDLVVGRDDGTVQAFAQADAGSVPELKGQVVLGSAITSVAVGAVSSPTSIDIVAATYTGVVTGFKTTAAFNETNESAMTTLQQRILSLENDIASLEVRKQPSGVVDPATNIQAFDVKDNFHLGQDASHEFTIESSVAIQMIVIKCDIKVEVSTSSDDLVHSTCEPTSAGGIVATYRCLPGTTRFQAQIQTQEGQNGNLETYVIPMAAAPKMCVKRQHRISALSWHQRTGLPLDEELPLNTLKLIGQFTLSNMHQWVALCLPGIETLRTETEDKDGVSVVFFSPFVGTQIECVYKAGEATFRSDNLSSISIVKDRIMKEATFKNIQIKMNLSISDESISHTLYKMAPRFEFYHSLMQQCGTLKALRELTSNNRNGEEILTAAQKLVLDDAEAIEKTSQDYPFHLDHMCDKVEKLYLDAFKSRGMDVRNKLPELRQLLENYSGMETIEEFFNQ
eukprot:m.47554 g.47554  ORF g.47554 m.47554 type:complete len:712 (-) comp20518_c0_seq1:192-2327(-)